MPMAADGLSGPDERERAIAVFCAFAAMLFFSVVPIFLRHFTAYLDLWTVNAVRYSVAAVFWLPFVIVLDRRGKAESLGPPVRSVWRAALVPAAVNLVGQVGWAASPYFVDAPTIGFVIRTSFLFAVLFGFLFIPPERLLARQPLFFVGVVVCVVGVVVMFAGKLSAAGGVSTRGVAGLAILLGTAACWGGYAVSVRRCLSRYPLRLGFGVISLYTSLGVVALMFAFGQYHRLGALPGRVWVLLVASGFIGIAFAHVLYHRAIHGIGPVVTSGIHMAGPFSTCLWAAVFLGETMAPAAFLGGLAVVAGGVVMVKAKAQVQKRSPAAAAVEPAAGGR